MRSTHPSPLSWHAIVPDPELDRSGEEGRADALVRRSGLVRGLHTRRTGRRSVLSEPVELLFA